MKFDIEHQKKLLNDIGGFAWALARPFEESKKIGGLAASASHDIGRAIECLLVGYDDAAFQLLTRAESWLLSSIRNSEIPQRYFPEATEAARLEDLSVCRWLTRSEHDLDSLAQAATYTERRLANYDDGKDKVEVGMSLWVFVDSGVHEQTLAIYSRTRGLTPPKALGNIRGEAQMSYVLSRHRLSLEYNEDEVTAAAKKFLNRNVNTWLTGGHAITAARWMKIIYWQEGRAGLSPKEALLKCFDHLPK